MAKLLSKLTTEDPCPCGSGHPFGDCCNRYIDGTASAPSAEALMRSRFTAYAIADARYLLDTWHPSTRPKALDFDPSQKWIRLKIVNSSEQEVEFVATCRINGRAHKLQECSRFLNAGGSWFYVDGDVQEE